MGGDAVVTAPAVHGVAAGPALEEVAAGQAAQRVVAGAAIDRVGLRRSGQAVSARRADDARRTGDAGDDGPEDESGGDEAHPGDGSCNDRGAKRQGTVTATVPWRFWTLVLVLVGKLRRGRNDDLHDLAVANAVEAALHLVEPCDVVAGAAVDHVELVVIGERVDDVVARVRRTACPDLSRPTSHPARPRRTTGRRRIRP